MEPLIFLDILNIKHDKILLNIRFTGVVGWSRMNNTLDKLKALNSKLDRKLSEKLRQASGGSTTPSTVESTRSNLDDQLSKRAKTPIVSIADVDKHQEPEEPLHQRLLSCLSIDANIEPVRSDNIYRLSDLYLKLQITKKVPRIEDLFIYKAMNISGIGLKDEDFGEIREGKYVQVIAITYEPDKNGKKKAKNISLGYFGKAETLEIGRKNEVIEFVLRWRYEKAFQNLEHYRMLLEKVRIEDLNS